MAVKMAEFVGVYVFVPRNLEDDASSYSDTGFPNLVAWERVDRHGLNVVSDLLRGETQLTC